jgi:inorganic pyrophosphatase
MQINSTFWEHIEKLVANSSVEIDRPKGTAHSRYPNSIYPVDYGYLAGTMSLDGGGIDVWLGSGDSNEVTGMMCAVDLIKRDIEIKILLGCSEEEMMTIEHFQNQGEQRSMLVRR